MRRACTKRHNHYRNACGNVFINEVVVNSPIAPRDRRSQSRIIDWADEAAAACGTSLSSDFENSDAAGPTRHFRQPSELIATVPAFCIRTATSVSISVCDRIRLSRAGRPCRGDAVVATLDNDRDQVYCLVHLPWRHVATPHDDTPSSWSCAG